MKITHLVETLERGGLERVVIDLVLAQREAGHDCRVGCLFQAGALAGELAAHGVEVHAFGKRDGLDIAVLSRLRRWLRRRPGGVLHTHNAAVHYHAIAAAAGLGFDAIVNTRHGMGAAHPRSRREWLYRRALSRTDAAVAVCEAARMRFAGGARAPGAGWRVVRNGVRVERFAAASETARKALAAELGFAPETRLIGTVGRLNPVKDQSGLLQAFALLHGHHPDTALVLVGDGPLRADLQTQAQALGVADAVRLLGDRGDVERLLPGLSLFALSSRSEGYSVALVEACAAALPLVATDVGGNAEIVRDGINGLLVRAGDPPALADAFAVLLSDPTRRSAMGQAGWRWAQAEGSLHAMVRGYDAVYSDAIGAGARR